MRSGPTARYDCRTLILHPINDTASADALCQLDDDSLGAADVAEPVAVLVSPQLSDELGAAGAQAGDNRFDVFDSEGDMADARCVRRLVPVAALGRWCVEFRQLESPVAVRGLQERDLCPDAFEPHDAVHPATLDWPFSLQFESKLDEELSCGPEVVNHDADVLHPLDRHLFNANESKVEPQRQAPAEDSWCLSFFDRSRRLSKDRIEDSEPAGVTDVDAVKNARRQEPIGILRWGRCGGPQPQGPQVLSGQASGLEDGAGKWDARPPADYSMSLEHRGPGAAVPRPQCACS